MADLDKEQIASKWGQVLGSQGTFESHFEALWDTLETIRALWGRLGTLWSTLGSFWDILGTFCDLSGTLKTLWGTLAPFWNPLELKKNGAQEPPGVCPQKPPRLPPDPNLRLVG
jgi:hypothetical protein